MTKTFLVTGASGFIGRRLTKYLKVRGFYVRALLRTPSEGPWDESYLAELGVDDISAEVMSSIDGVFHLAGVAHTTISNSSEIENHYWQVNVKGTSQLLQAAVDANVKCFVNFSSVKAGGEHPEDCLDENSDYQPADVYGQSKYEAEKLVLQAGHESGMHVCNLRPALIYGKGIKGNIYKMMRSIEQGRFPPVPEFGNRRSMVSLDDLIEAAWLAMNTSTASGETYIVTDGVEYSTREIYQSIVMAYGMTVPRYCFPKSVFRFGAKVGDFMNNLFGIEMPLDSYKLNKLSSSACYKADKVRRELGWKPQFSFADVLSDIIKEMGDKY